ncbi:MAG: stage IV sporulation protein A [Firmicutes bacterium]|nr:stage IV sporulation protein A [Bacillota bacterium]
MANTQIFHDIATRTNGDIYIGVVGPVRTGKSTFITRFMQSHIVPKVENKDERNRVVDELPQSADGVTIMTTQPKFVPASAVNIKIGSAAMRVRMVDCVGYMVPGASGHLDGERPRLVKTPWSDTEMPFEKAAEIGTKKVITEHSTIAVVMTTDGTVTDIPRDNYVKAEERVIAQLKKLGKPFIVVVNSKEPHSQECQTLASDIARKHTISVLPINVATMGDTQVNQIFASLLAEFPVNGFRVTMPGWLTVLDRNHDIIAEAIEALKRHTASVKRLADNDTSKVFEKSANFTALETTHIDIATGIVTYNVVAADNLYFNVLSVQSGTTIQSDAQLVAFIKHFGDVKSEYDRLRTALTSAKESGYGVVAPSFQDFTLEAPALFKSGKSHGIKFRASAPSLHLVRVDVQTEIAPAIGSKEQSEEMLKLIRAEYDKDANALWQTPIFGKSLESLVTEGISTKAAQMPQEAKRKMKRTLTKIVNNGRGGIICILL